MHFAPGTRLGAYEILSIIGSGGMGQVYRARDPRLGRDVALKALPSTFSGDSDRLRRFELEARATAALSHPNVLNILDVGTHQGVPFVVSELLEGQTLRQAIASGPLPLRKALDYATQIATGLAAAHDKGIIHRDLKPENLFITGDGRVKILDFGLAKWVNAEPAGTPTMTATIDAGTTPGTVLGSMGYMSPEQVNGEPTDARTDVFAFGTVLYEMLAGRRAFKADSAAGTMAAILKDDPPDLVDTGRTVPPALKRVVRHCLEKSPAMRFQAMRDIVFSLESISDASVTTVAQPPAARNGRGPLYAFAAIASAVVIAAAIFIVTLQRANSPVFRQVTFRHGVLGSSRFTPDGQSIVYTAAWEGAPPEIFMVPANERGGRPVEISNANLLAVSRSGELAVALTPAAVTNYLRPGTLARGSLTGGAPKPEIEQVLFADYAPDGKSLAIVRYMAAEHVCQVEYPVGKVIYRDAWPSDLRFSPDGRYLGLIAHPDNGDDRGYAVILRTNGEKVASGPVIESHRGLVWSPTGDEVWTSSPLMVAAIHALSLSGRSRDVLQLPGRIHLRDSIGGRLLADYGAVRRGMIVASGAGLVERDVTWLDFSVLRAISDDGQMMLFEEEGGAVDRSQAFVRTLDGSPAVRIGPGYAVALSADKSLALSLTLTTPPELWLLPVGAGQPRRLSPPNLTPTTNGRFFRDGKRIVYVAAEGDRPSRTYLQSLNGGAPEPLTPEGVTATLLSPDEKWLAGRGPSARVLVPLDGGPTVPIRGLEPDEPAPSGWTSDGRLYIRVAATGGLRRIDLLNPWTGGRVRWRDLPGSPIVGLTLGAPLMTPDGTSYGYNYSLSAADLHVVTGIR